jgi:hypothetical protein
MKRIILFIGIFLLTVNLLGQTGTGWAQQRAKMNFKDSTNFVKAATFENTIIMNGSAAGSTTLRPFTTASGTLVYPTSAETDTIATRAYARSYGGGGGASYAWIDSANYYNKTFLVTDPQFGAIEGDATCDADEIQAAIDKAASWVSNPTYWEAGGTVIIPAGEWSLSKSLILRSQVTVKIDEGARFSKLAGFTGAFWTNPSDEALLSGVVDGGFYYSDRANDGIELVSTSSARYVMFTEFRNMRFYMNDSVFVARQLSNGWITGVRLNNMYSWRSDVGIYTNGAAGSPITIFVNDFQFQTSTNSTNAIYLDNYSYDCIIRNFINWDNNHMPGGAKSIVLGTYSARNEIHGWGLTNMDYTYAGTSNSITDAGHITTPDSLTIIGNFNRETTDKLKILGDGRDYGTMAIPGAETGIFMKSGTYGVVDNDNSAVRLLARNFNQTNRGSQIAFQTHGVADMPKGGFSDVMVLDYNGTVITPFRNTGTVSNSGGITHAQLARLMYYDEAAATDITADPQIVCNEAYARDGTIITIMGSSDTNTLKLDDGDGLQLAGGTSFTLGDGDTITLVFSSTKNLWIELSRSDN